MVILAIGGGEKTKPIQSQIPAFGQKSETLTRISHNPIEKSSLF